MAEDMNPKPSVGCVVHYRDEVYSDDCIAAIITKVWTEDKAELVSLCVLYLHGTKVIHDIHKGTTNGSWHWPERV